MAIKSKQTRVKNIKIKNVVGIVCIRYRFNATLRFCVCASVSASTSELEQYHTRVPVLSSTVRVPSL